MTATDNCPSCGHDHDAHYWGRCFVCDLGDYCCECEDETELFDGCEECADCEGYQRSTCCVDCGTECLPVDDRRAEWYIVTDEVWTAAGMTPAGGCLCIGCLEARIGRQLTAADFPGGIGLNDLSISDNRKAWSWRTPRLTARLSDSGQLALPLDADTA